MQLRRQILPRQQTRHVDGVTEEVVLHGDDLTPQGGEVRLRLRQQLPQERGGGGAGGDGEGGRGFTVLLQTHGTEEILLQRAEHPHAVFQLAVALVVVLLRDTERVQNRYEASYGYSDGTFVMDGTVTFTDGTWLTEPVPYKLYRTMKKTMTVGELNLGDLVVFPYEDWPYGKLLLALGNDRALIVADQTDAFVVVELLGTYYGDIEDGEVHMTHDHIQAIADSFSLAPSDK